MAVNIIALVFTLCVAAFGIWLIVFWIRMIIHAATHEVPNKVAWIIVLCLLQILGAIIYYYVVYKKFKKGITTA